MAVTPPSTQVAEVTTLTGIEQFVLLAARPGDLARNDNTQRTGIYTRELLEELKSLPPEENWSEQLPQITSRLQSRFDELRAQGRTRQTPDYFWFKHGGNEYSLGDAPRAESSPIEPQSSLPRTLTLSERGKLGDLFLACASMQSQAKRGAIVDELSPEIARAISRESDSNTDILNILKTVGDFPGGLAQLVEAVHLYEGNTLSFQNLYSELERMLPEVIEEIRGTPLLSALATTLNDLTDMQLSQLMKNLSMPPEITPNSTVRGERITTLLEWVKTPGKPGTIGLQEELTTLSKILLTQQKKTQIFALSTDSPWQIPCDVLIFSVSPSGDFGQLANSFQKAVYMQGLS
jgi:hypothetical protein